MLQAFRLQQGNEALSYQQMKAALGEPKSAVPADRETALSSGGWWLRSVVGTGDDGIDALGSAFTGVVARPHSGDPARVRRVHRVRRLRAEAGAVLDPCAPDTALSVTELEKAAECPFRFFLKRGLGSGRSTSASATRTSGWIR